MNAARPPRSSQEPPPRPIGERNAASALSSRLSPIRKTWPGGDKGEIVAGRREVDRVDRIGASRGGAQSPPSGLWLRNARIWQNFGGRSAADKMITPQPLHR